MPVSLPPPLIVKIKRPSPSAVLANLSTNRRICPAVGQGRPSTSLALVRPRLRRVRVWADCVRFWGTRGPPKLCAETATCFHRPAGRRRLHHPGDGPADRRECRHLGRRRLRHQRRQRDHRPLQHRRGARLQPGGGGQYPHRRALPRRNCHRQSADPVRLARSGSACPRRDMPSPPRPGSSSFRCGRRGRSRCCRASSTPARTRTASTSTLSCRINATLERRRRASPSTASSISPGGDQAHYFDIGIAPAWRPREDTEVRAYYGVQDRARRPQHPVHLRRRDRPSPAPPQPLPRPGLGGMEEPLHVDGHVRPHHLRRLAAERRHLPPCHRQPAKLQHAVRRCRMPTAARAILVNIHPPRLTESNAGRRSGCPDRSTRVRAATSSICPPAAASAPAISAAKRWSTSARSIVGEVPPEFPEPDVEFGEETKRQGPPDTARDRLSRPVARRRRVQRRRPEGPLSQDHHRRPTKRTIVTRAEPWLWNGTLAVNLFKGLVAYAGYTKGLEDSGVAPEIAVNRSEAPPALLTSQRDIGLRYAFGPMRLRRRRLRRSQALFQPRPRSRLHAARHRPSSRSRNLARGRAGQGPQRRRRRGADEAAGQRRRGRLGPDRAKCRSARPNAPPRPNLDYRLPLASGPFGEPRHPAPRQARGKRRQSADSAWPDPGQSRRPLPFRDLAKLPATLRLQVSNLFDDYAWNVTGSGGFRRVFPRRANAHLVGRLLGAQQRRSHGLGQSVRPKRLRQQRRIRCNPADRVRLAVAGDEQDRLVRVRRQDAARNVGSGQARHDEVEDDEVGFLGARRRSVPTCRRWPDRRHSPARRATCAMNSRTSGSSSMTRIRSAAGPRWVPSSSASPPLPNDRADAVGAARKKRLTVVPLPGSLSMRASPPDCRAMP